MPRSFEAYVTRKIGDIDREYVRRLLIGWPMVIDGEPVLFEGEPETLQLRDVVDQTRWLVILGICDEAVFAEFGELPLPPSGLRCTSNRNVAVSFSQAGAALRELRSWGIAMQLNWTRLKDLARSVAHRDGLNLIDLGEGWP